MLLNMPQYTGQNPRRRSCPAPHGNSLGSETLGWADSEPVRLRGLGRRRGNSKNCSEELLTLHMTFLIFSSNWGLGASPT